MAAKKQNGIDAAIAAEAAKPQVQMREWRVTITSTGRPAAALLPVDLTDAELAEFAGWLLTTVMAQYRTARLRGPASRIVLPGMQ